MQRITFGNLDCVAPCEGDALADVFDNGTYAGLRGTNTLGVSESLLGLILSQSQTFPNSSTASGFTFRFGGTQRPTLESELYGPLFGERALTNGKGQLSVTFNMHSLRFSSIDGSNIRNGEEGLLWGDTNYDGNGNGYAGICRMNINTTVMFGALNYGLLEKLDVSAAVPIVHTTVDGSNEFVDYVFRDNTLRPFEFFSPADGFSELPGDGRYYVKGSSTGLGDIALGVKYAFVRRAEAGAAVGVRVSLPTGSLEEMTGTGEFQTAFNFVGSFERNGFSPHVNLGYLAAAGNVFNELNYNVGLGYRAMPDRLTLGVEYVGRRLFDVTTFDVGRQLGSFTSPETNELFRIHEFTPVERGVNLNFLAIGGKLRLTGQWLASAYAVLPTGNTGLQVQRPTFNFGINYAR
jgi:hypothetical protein